MRGQRSTSLGLFAVTVAGILLFCRGFFPVKPLLPGFAESHLPPHVEPPFSRLVFILVDALRSDFAFGSGHQMPFVNSIVEQGHGSGFTALAQAPTVTLPRLKALTTGSNPTFLDAILNIAEASSSAVLEQSDSWVRQLAQGHRKKRLVFAGDDTWLRIFPRDWFEWAEGVSSFFVSDTITVDTNVTRHLTSLLTPTSPPAETSFDVLILHYLGLDHVGHLGGAASPLMGPKQAEMDDVVRRVFEYLREQDERDGQRSLLVLTGDHGMTETGNHGGSTEPETHSALLIAAPSHPSFVPPPAPRFFSPLRQHAVVNQIDLVPTLAVLFGVGIPTNSMGKLIKTVLDVYYPHDITAAFRANVKQLSKVLEIASPGAILELQTEVERLFGEAGWDDLEGLDAASQFLTLAQERLMITFGDYHLLPIFAGLFLLGSLVVAAWCMARPTWRGRGAYETAALGAALLPYLGTMFATSFIEEEHEFWYFGTTTLLLLLALRPSNGAVGSAQLASAALSVRLMRSWSFNGQKDFLNHSISSVLSSSPRLTTALTILTCLFFSFSPIDTLRKASRQLSRRQIDIPLQQLALRALGFGVLAVLTLLCGGLLLAFKTESSLPWLAKVELDQPVGLARVVVMLGGLGWLTARVGKSLDPAAAETYDALKINFLILLLASFTRPTNVPLLVLLRWQYTTLSRASSSLSPLLFTSLVIAFQHVSFFAFGGSNSLATVDLSQAYNGITAYSMPLVSLQTFVSNFAGPIFWALASPPLLQASSITSHASPTSSWSSHSALASLFHASSFFALAASATHFRSHLFVWTVFSPALLYKGAWSLLVHWAIGVGVAALQ